MKKTLGRNHFRVRVVLLVLIITFMPLCPDNVLSAETLERKISDIAKRSPRMAAIVKGFGRVLTAKIAATFLEEKFGDQGAAETVNDFLSSENFIGEMVTFSAFAAAIPTTKVGQEEVIKRAKRFLQAQRTYKEGLGNTRTSAGNFKRRLALAGKIGGPGFGNAIMEATKLKVALPVFAAVLVDDLISNYLDHPDYQKLRDMNSPEKLNKMREEILRDSIKESLGKVSVYAQAGIDTGHYLITASILHNVLKSLKHLSRGLKFAAAVPEPGSWAELTLGIALTTFTERLMAPLSSTYLAGLHNDETEEEIRERMTKRSEKYLSLLNREGLAKGTPDQCRSKPATSDLNARLKKLNTDLKKNNERILLLYDRLVRRRLLEYSKELAFPGPSKKKKSCPLSIFYGDSPLIKMIEAYKQISETYSLEELAAQLIRENTGGDIFLKLWDEYQSLGKVSRGKLSHYQRLLERLEEKISQKSPSSYIEFNMRELERSKNKVRSLRFKIATYERQIFEWIRTCDRINSYEEIVAYKELESYHDGMKRRIFMGREFENRFYDKEGKVMVAKLKKWSNGWFSDPEKLEVYRIALRHEQKIFQRVNNTSFKRPGLQLPSASQPAELTVWSGERIKRINEELGMNNSRLAAHLESTMLTGITH